MNAKDVAAGLHFGDRVNGMTANGVCFTGYLCNEPEAGRTGSGDDATVVYLASHPIPGRGSVWAITGTTRLNVLPVDPAVAAELAANLDGLRLDDDQYKQVAQWCADHGHPISEETR